MKARRSPRVARTRGQVMVLACVTLLVTALMLMLSFNLTNAVYEKMRVQSHSDSVAYSLATVESRAFNATAHYNRAIAAALVAQMSLHSWMAIASADVGMLNAGMIDMFEIMAIEAAMGCYPYNVSHCPCVFMAMRDAFKFMRKGREYAKKLRGLEQKFNDGVQDLRKMVESLHKRQKAILNLAAAEISGVGSVVSKLTKKNAKKADVANAFIAVNVREFTCAQEGGVDSTGGSNCSGRPRADSDVRSTVIQNAANATRQLFNKDNYIPYFVNDENFRSPYDTKLPQDQLSDGHFIYAIVPPLNARVAKNSSGTGSNKNDTTLDVGSGVRGVASVMGYRHSGISAMVFNGEIHSNSSGGKHTVSPFGTSAHSGRHGEFSGVQTADVCGNEESCFVNFRALNDASKDFGMPSVFIGVKQDLRLFQTKDGEFKEHAPWEINDDGKVSIELAKGAPSEIQLTPRATGYAVSKAKVYFHQQGNWKVAPNFFDPFWRPKLHFFDKSELTQALTLVGDTKGIQYNALSAPVEGE